MGKLAVNDKLFEVIYYALTCYRSEESGLKFDVLDYYSFTDLSPLELAREARMRGYKTLSTKLQLFYTNREWLFVPTTHERQLKKSYTFREHEITIEEKEKIFTSLCSENMPLIEGVYGSAMRKYVFGGENALTSDNIRSKVIKAYNIVTDSDVVEVNGELISSSECLDYDYKVLTKKKYGLNNK